MKKHIPNIITLLNLVCGSCAVILSLWELYFPAFWFIIGAAMFDFMDGFFARLLKAYSDIGKELDSLSDLISFGLAPSLMFFTWYYKSGHEYSLLSFIPLIIVAFSALRLAKFNTDTRQSVNFIGLPTPADAMIIASVAAYGHVCRLCGTDSIVLQLLDSGWFIPVCSIILSLLLVSEIPMFSLKKKKLSFRTNPTICLFLSVSVLLVVTGEILYPHKSIALGNIPLWIALVFAFYLILNLIIAPFGKKES
ncbi:MAG: CDP-diacylglycerol--serine O-phosphatidyltransferase [Bacteroidales bacterium]|nr:CDP-diacylglycerol--serine O-phosphatidyltransferase [Bacteroidales bacterium]MDD4670201.1 CDP-diacylglycerol--serine O-phosphatidyltransferase [Bacteroidales bacterium]